jgi:hypothetical protein
VIGVFAIAPGWHLGDLYTLGLAAVGVTVLIGVMALSRQHDRAFPASVFYVAVGAVGARWRCPCSTCLRWTRKTIRCC